MPTDFSISLKNYTDNFSIRIPEDFGPKQEMVGFEPTYNNIVDYIVRITYRIWEDRDVEYIADTYAPDSVVFDDYGLKDSNAKIISDTYHTTGAFSDIVLDAREVIWAGDDDIGWRSSHRLMIAGTNDGDSNYGAATGKKTNYLCLANCVTKANDIYLEQVLYNSCAMLMQLGIDPREEAARLAKSPPGGWPRDAATWERLRTEGGPKKPISLAEPVDGFDPDEFTRRIHIALFNNKDVDSAYANFVDGFSFENASLRQGSGRDAHSAMLSEILDTLSNISFQVDEVYWMGNDEEGYLVSTRWSMDAVHAKDGIYDAPTNAPLQIWGITQHEIQGGKITQEWMLFNEMDVMIQIAHARMEHST